ncbi:MAG: hypothetical protein FWC40_08505, partial [Proteobacteria bacterium]|nr:hypothetical protein [Pseudomonadota bacterium]
FASRWAHHRVRLISGSCLTAPNAAFAIANHGRYASVSLIREVFLQVLGFDERDEESVGRCLNWLEAIGFAPDDVIALMESLTSPFESDVCSRAFDVVMQRPEMLARIVLASSREMPIFLLIDDVQRCHGAVFEFLSILRDHCQSTPFFCLATYDPTEVNGLSPYSVEIRQSLRYAPLFSEAIELEPLRYDIMMKILKEGASLSPNLAERIIARASGNPYYALACVHQLRREARLMPQGSSSFGLAVDDDQPLNVPDVVKRYFQARFQAMGVRLGANEGFYREVLLRLSILGPCMRFEDVALFWDNEPDVALADCWREAIAAWCDYGMLRMSRDSRGQTLLYFYESWVVDVIQGWAPARKLRELHRQAATVFGKSDDVRRSFRVSQIAAHWEAARQWTQYARTLCEAAGLAYNEGMIDAAQRQYDLLMGLYRGRVMSEAGQGGELWQAVDWTEVLYEGARIGLRFGHELRFEWHCEQLAYLTTRRPGGDTPGYLQLLRAMFEARAGRHEVALHRATLARDLFESPLGKQRALACMASANDALGSIALAVSWLEMACDGFDALEAAGDWVRAKCLLSRMSWQRGDLAGAIEAGQAAAGVLSSYEMAVESMDLGLLSVVSELWSNPDEALEETLGALGGHFARFGDVLAYAECELCRCMLGILCHDFEGARARFEALKSHLVSRCRPESILPIEAWEYGLLGFEYAFEGMDFEARHAFDMALGGFEAGGARFCVACVHLCLALFAMHAGHGSGWEHHSKAARDIFSVLHHAHGLTWVEVGEVAWLASQGEHKRVMALASAVCGKTDGFGGRALGSMAAAMGLESSLVVGDGESAQAFALRIDMSAWPGFFLLSRQPYLERIHEDYRGVLESGVICFGEEGQSRVFPSLCRSLEIDMKPQKYMPSFEVDLGLGE